MPEVIIPFQDLRRAYEELRVDLDQAYRRFMESGWYVLGQEVDALEEEYANYCGAAHCVGVGSGLEALHLALLAVGCSAGDEVIVASNTYIATWLSVIHTGATIVPVEPDESTYNLDPGLVEKAITPKTKVVLATNLYGQPCDYDALNAIARKHGLIFMTDNAQAHGASYKGKRVGALADVECHSFYPSKNLGAFGEAGAVTTSDCGVTERIRLLRNYGSRSRYHNEVIGYNSRIDELQAAFLRVKLKHLDEWNARRKSLAALYKELLCDLSSQVFHTTKCQFLPTAPVWSDPVWHLFVIRHPDRDALQRRLQGDGIQTIIHYPIPPHLSDACKSLGFPHGAFPIAERMANEVLSLPISPHHSGEQINRVVQSLRKHLAR